MPIEKITRPDSILFRFDPNSPTPILRGAAYYTRTFYQEGGVETPGSSKEDDAQPVSIAKGVKGLDLAAILGTLAAGQQAVLDEQAAAIDAHAAELAAKDANIQALMAQVEALTKNPGPGSAAEPSPEAPAT